MIKYSSTTIGAACYVVFQEPWKSVQTLKGAVFSNCSIISKKEEMLTVTEA